MPVLRVDVKTGSVRVHETLFRLPGPWWDDVTTSP